MELDTKAE